MKSTLSVTVDTSHYTSPFKKANSLTFSSFEAQTVSLRPDLLCNNQNFLYVQERLVHLVSTTKQQTEPRGELGEDVLSNELCKSPLRFLSPSVLDVMVDKPELWPEQWKVQRNPYGDSPVFVLFPDVLFEHPDTKNLCVRYGFWDDGRVKDYYTFLHQKWGRIMKLAMF